MKSKNLFEIQTQFFNSLKNVSQSAVTLEQILGRTSFSNEARLNIYQTAYQIRLVNSISEDFSRVEIECGKEEFESIIQKFISSIPSTTKNLAEYSQFFVDYIKEAHPQHLKAAILDWGEIVSEYALEPADAVNAWQIETEMKDGLGLKIKTHPASQIYQLGEQSLLIFRKFSVVEVKELAPFEVDLFRFFQYERTQDEILKFMETLGADLLGLSQTISDWLKNKIIYCKKGSQ